MLYRLMLVLSLGFLSGCFSHDFVATPVNPKTGLYPQMGNVPVNVEVYQLENTPMMHERVYLKMDYHGSQSPLGYQNLLIQAFTEFNFFDEVVVAPRQHYLNVEPPTPFELDGQPWYIERSPLSLDAIRERYRDSASFLIVETSFWELSHGLAGKRRVRFDLRAVNSSTGRVVYAAHSQSQNIFGADKMVIYPVLNDFNKWLVRTHTTYSSHGVPRLHEVHE